MGGLLPAFKMFAKGNIEFFRVTPVYMNTVGLF